jgi:aspartate racemase
VKHIGILAHSSEGATLCYRTMWMEGVDRLGAHRHPEITLTGVDMGQTMEAWERGNHASLRSLFLRDMDKLAAAGADFFVLPDNTAHIALESEGPEFPIPCLHIAEVVAGEAKRLGHRRIGILGTEWTMTGPVYADALGRARLAWSIPDKADRSIVHRIIFEELCLGEFRQESRAEYLRIIGKLAAAGCDAVALVCTEIPLLITPELSPLPVLDSTRLLARAAVEVALNERPMPGWRGGPIGFR